MLLDIKIDMIRNGYIYDTAVFLAKHGTQHSMGYLHMSQSFFGSGFTLEKNPIILNKWIMLRIMFM